jgi:hypothetical protein
MITNFRDFCQFSAEKIGVLLINQGYDNKFFSKTRSSLSKKRQFFAHFLGENI